MADNIISVLWTGGWDSTFRLCELSRMDVTIQPVYVIDPNRKSKDLEINAMDIILNQLRNRPESKAIILDLIKINLFDIPKNEQITKAFQIIHDKTNLGSQHEWLARLATLYPGIEIGTEAGSTESSFILRAISEYGVLIKDGNTYKIDKNNSKKEGKLIFGNLSFPIIDKTEEDMTELIKLWGYEDIMKNIWFCHSPIKLFGKFAPCGVCHPCQVKIASNMTFLLPEKSVKKGKWFKKIEKVLGSRITKKIFSFLIKFN